jgi:hypothetical protein
LATIAYEIDGVGYVEEMLPGEPIYRYEWVYLNEDIGPREELVVTILNITAWDIFSNWILETYDRWTITILKEDVEGPEIEPEALPLYTESEDHLIMRAAVTDPSGVASVTLHYDKDGSWFERNMLPNENNSLYEAIVGPFETDDAVRYYITATDGSANQNLASTLDDDGGEMRSFVTSFRKRFEGVVNNSEYQQVAELHRYGLSAPGGTILYEGYVFELELGSAGLITGNVSLDNDGNPIHLQDLAVTENDNAIVIDQSTKDGVAYDFNLKYLSFNPTEGRAEIEINPRQRLVFEGYTIQTSIKRRVSGPTTFIGEEGGEWQVNVTVEVGYESLTKTFTSRNQFLKFFVGGRRDIQIMYLGEERAAGDLTRYGAKLRVYKFQPPMFNVTSNVPTGSPSGLSEDQIIYNVYAGDDLPQMVIAENLAGSRAYDITISVTNVDGEGLVVSQGDLSSSLGPVYRETLIGSETIRYYLS